MLLRQVPIVQTPKEVRGLLDRLKGRYDLIFGHMKAIGTFGKTSHLMLIICLSKHSVFTLRIQLIFFTVQRLKIINFGIF